MVIFVIIISEVIFLLHGYVAAGCDQNAETQAYYKCLNKWRAVREHMNGPSAFLKDDTLIDEICILPGVTIDDMNKCVTESVSLFCEAIMAHWGGFREFLTFLCKRRDAFLGTHAQCRKNKAFQASYERCWSEHNQEVHNNVDYCRSITNLTRCQKTALDTNCAASAVQFFSLAFSYRDEPLIEYSCKKDEPSEYDIYLDKEKDESWSNGKPALEKGETEFYGKPGLENVETRESYFYVKTVYEEESGTVHVWNMSVVAWTLILAIATSFLVIWY